MLELTPISPADPYFPLATDLTNELLKSNADNLKQANAEARKQMERGVFDIEVVKQANQTLIDTIEESLRIADEGNACLCPIANHRTLTCRPFTVAA